MKLKQSIRYQLADFIGPVIIYYGVVIALHIVLCLAWIFGSIRAYMSGGLSAFSTVFLFICGLCSFHDNLPMHLQNGVSRKTMYTRIYSPHRSFPSSSSGAIFFVWASV